MSFWGALLAVADTAANVALVASQVAPNAENTNAQPRKPCGHGPILKGRNCPKVRNRKNIFVKEK